MDLRIEYLRELLDFNSDKIYGHFTVITESSIRIKIMKTSILLKRITRDPGILLGKPIIRGMRIGVDTILNDLASGLTFAEIIEQHPMLDEKDIKACILFTEKSMNELDKLKQTA